MIKSDFAYSCLEAHLQSTLDDFFAAVQVALKTWQCFILFFSHCIFSVKVLRVVDVDDPHVARVSR